MRRLPGQPHVLPQSHQISVTKPCFQVFSASSAFTLCSTDSPALFWSVCRLCPLCRDLALGVVHAEVDAAVAKSSLPGCVPPAVAFTRRCHFQWLAEPRRRYLIPCRRPGLRSPLHSFQVICTATAVSSLMIHIMLSPAMVSASLVPDAGSHG